MEKNIPTHAVKAVITNDQGDILFLEREVEEELRRKATVGRELGRWAFFRPFDGNTVEVTNYAVTLDTTNVADLTLSHEHTAAEFISREKLPQLEVKDPSILEALNI